MVTWWALFGLFLFAALLANGIREYRRNVTSVRAMATFEAQFPPDREFDHPEGAYLIRQVESRLKAFAQTVEEFDNWRDCGWVVGCQVDGIDVLVYFVHSSENKPWEFSVEAQDASKIAAVRKVAMELHAMLASDPHVSRLRWSASLRDYRDEVAEPSQIGWLKED